MKSLNDHPGRLLLFGIGNSGRADDGIGWKFVEMLSEMEYPFLDCEYRYQLQVEDAALAANYNMVIFVDASQEQFNDGFRIDCCIAAHHYAYSSHAQEPGAILYLTNNLYNKFPKAYTLVISGVDWELRTGLSSEAEQHLQAALFFFEKSFIPAIRPELEDKQIPVGSEEHF